MRALLAALVALLPVSAWAQTSPSLYYGQVPSATQWNGYFSGKVDYPLKSYAIADLPTCNSSRAGALLLVTDASGPTYGAVLVDGGSTVVMALCTGSDWTAH